MVYIELVGKSIGARLEDPKRGQLLELSGPEGAGKTETLLRYLSETPELKNARIAWIEEDLTIYPCGLGALDLGRVLFLDCKSGDEVLWAAHQVLRSQLYKAVVLKRQASTYEEMDLRKLQLAAERSGTQVLLLSEAPTRKSTWPISTQIEIVRARDQNPEFRILKARGDQKWLRTG